MSLTAKRFTQGYSEDIIGFLENKFVHTVPKEEFKWWLLRQHKYLDRNGVRAEELEKKKEYFFIGEPGQGEWFNVFGVALVKFPSPRLAQAKCIIVDTKKNNYRRNTRILLRVIEKYCSEKSYVNLEIFTNDRNDTAHIGREHSAYNLAYTIKSFNGIDEFIYRRRLVPDYLGDPTNWRDMALWYLETHFSEIFLIDTQGDVISKNGKQHSFLIPKYQYMCGCLKDEEEPCILKFNLNSKTNDEVSGTQVFLKAKALIINKSVKQSEVSDLVGDTENADVIYLFAHDCPGNREARGIRIITWSDVFDRILWVRRKNYATTDYADGDVKILV